MPDARIGLTAIFQDAGRFWHLALVEAPEDKDGEHFFELVEMLDGGWLSERNLPVEEHEDSEVDWEYGKAYSLRLVLSESRIRGEVRGEGGETLWSKAYGLREGAVRQGRPCLRVSAVAADFDDVVVKGDGSIPRKRVWSTSANWAPAP